SIETEYERIMCETMSGKALPNRANALAGAERMKCLVSKKNEGVISLPADYGSAEVPNLDGVQRHIEKVKGSKRSAKSRSRGATGDSNSARNSPPTMSTLSSTLDHSTIGGQLFLSSISPCKALFEMFRAFPVSTPRAFASTSKYFYAAAKKTTKKTSSTSRSSAARKTTTRSSAAKKKPTTRKAAPKKKVVAKKKKVTVKKHAKPAKKVVTKRATPRTDASLRAPPRSVNAFSLFVKRIFPTLSPKPANAPAGMPIIRNMWENLTQTEKKAFESEAEVLNAERRATYDKWRASLTAGDVRIINEYRSKGKHSKLGPRPSSARAKRPLSAYMKFYQECLNNGKIDPAKTPENIRFVVYASKEAGRLWKAMTPAEKK
ncbi:15970_t:CDS:2, partial [Acaulospora colombiana]